jgi:hypothetical protein
MLIFLFGFGFSLSSLFFLIESSYPWVIRHIGINSRNFIDMMKIQSNLSIDINYTAHFNAIEILGLEVNKYTKIYYVSLGIIGVIFLFFTIFTAIRYKKTEANLNKDLENLVISLIGIFLGICFGLSTAEYLLLCSSVTDYYNQLIFLNSVGTPYDNLPFESWNPSVQTLYIGYMGFLIISILLLLSLFTRIFFVTSKCKAWKNCSDGYLFASILLSIFVFFIFFNLDMIY